MVATGVVVVLLHVGDDEHFRVKFVPLYLLPRHTCFLGATSIISPEPAAI